jgi:hypothetical protein
MKMERYFDQLNAGKTRLRPLPSAHPALLPQRLPNKVHEAGVSRAIEIATETKAKADSAAPKGGMQPAPGGPPIPGGMPQPMRPPGATPAPSGKQQ